MKRLLSQLFYCPDICSLKTYTKNENTRPSELEGDARMSTSMEMTMMKSNPPAKASPLEKIIANIGNYLNTLPSLQ